MADDHDAAGKVEQGRFEVTLRTPAALDVIAPIIPAEATVTASGFKTATTTFTVKPGEEITVTVTLEPDKPIETPHVKANKNSIRLTKKISYTNANDVSDKSKPILDELATMDIAMKEQTIAL